MIQLRIGSTRHTVYRVIRSHDRQRTGIYRLTERRKKVLNHIALGDNRIVSVLSTFGHGIRYEMLQRGYRGERLVKLTASQSAYFCSTKRTAQHRIFTERLLHSAPARVAGKIEHRTIADMSTLQTHFLTDYTAHFLKQSFRPCSRQPYTRREHCSADSHMTVRSLFSQEHRDAQAGVLNDILLQCVSGLGSLLRIQSIVQRLLRPRVGTIHSPQHTCVTLAYQLLELLGRNHVLTFYSIHLPSKRTKQLTNLFLCRHAREQIVYTSLYGQLRILIRKLLGLSLCTHCRCHKKQ